MSLPKVSKEVRDLKAKAEAAYAARKWKKALEAYEALEKAGPGDPRILQRMGDLCRRLGDDAGALAHYKKVSSLYSDQGFWAKAIAVGKLALEIDPRDLTVQQRLAQMYAKQDTHSRTQPGTEKAPSAFAAAVEERAAISISGEDPRAAEPAAALDLVIGNTVSFSVEQLGSEPETTPENDPLGRPQDRLRQGIPLFSDMDVEELSAVLDRLAVRRFPAETLVCEEGDLGRSMYVIAEGWVEVFSRDASGKRVVLGRLRGGEFFGEFGLLTNGTRNASVQAKTDVELLEITSTDFESIAAKHPRVWRVLEDYIRRRMVFNILTKSPVFGVLTDEERAQLTGRVTIRPARAGEIVAPQGSPGDEMFFIRSGAVVVWISKDGHERIVVGELGAGDYFGEVAMLTGKPRTATVEARTDCELFALKRRDAAQVLRGNREVLERLRNKMDERAQDTIAAYRSYLEARTTLDLV